MGRRPFNLSRRGFVASGLALSACSGSGGGTAPPAPPPQLAGRVVGVHPTEREDDDFNIVADRVEDLGGEIVSLSLYWDDIEVSPGVYAPSPNFPQIANEFYRTRNFRLSVSLVGIDTNNDRRPADLLALPYDDPGVISRFEALAAFVLDQLPDVTIDCFAIGNEIDGLLGGDVAKWEAYRRFFAAVAPGVKARLPGACVGAKATFGVVVDEPARTQYAALVDGADAWLLTYYPLNADFTVQSPSAVQADFARMAGAPGAKPVRLLEIGFPTSSVCGSSEALQAEFITRMFASWDDYSNRIREIDYFCLHDFDPAIITVLETYYGVSSPQFAGFLGTLGLRAWAGDGGAKSGYQRFKEEVARRR